MLLTVASFVSMPGWSERMYGMDVFAVTLPAIAVGSEDELVPEHVRTQYLW